MNRNGDWIVRDKVLRAGEGHGWSAHEHAVLTLVVHGRLDEGLETEVQRCDAFELHYKPRGLPHATFTGPEGVRMFLIGLRGATLDALEEAGGPRVVGGGARAARALTDFLSIAEAEDRPDTMPRDAILRLWRHLRYGESIEAPRRPCWITEVHERIRSERAERESLTNLARRFRVHPVYLARAFRASYGVTIGAVRRRLRAERALVRLRTERTPLADLALDLGYADQNHFCRELKRETGWTPARFRAVCASFSDAARRG